MRVSISHKINSCLCLIAFTTQLAAARAAPRFSAAFALRPRPLQLPHLLGCAHTHTHIHTHTHTHRQRLCTRSHAISDDASPLHFPVNKSMDAGAVAAKPLSSRPRRLPKPPSTWDALLRQRWRTGLSLGAFATVWLFSGNGLFMLGFCFISILAQLEYYHMVQNTGVEPALKIGTLSSILCYVSAARFPMYHEMVLPLAATMVMTWLLLMKQQPATINEISTTFLGMFYVGYLPSFWVRLRALQAVEPTRFPALMHMIPWLGTSLADAWTLGAVITWWTWISIVCADVGAYFIGKNFGHTKLSAVSKAAGTASPKKTVEGAVGGLVSCTLMSILGAWLMKWPFWLATGTAYGFMLSVIALVGDLTASMFKRDAGVKDSGCILPGHGGLLDRVDSYMFTAPCAYIFCVWLLPFARKVSTLLP